MLAHDRVEMIDETKKKINKTDNEEEVKNFLKDNDYILFRLQSLMI